jgi:hypothetical protein
MKVAKQSAGKSKAKTAPVKMEYSGHFVESNIWFRLGLSKTEARMLKVIAVKKLTSKATSAEAARFLLQGALAHFDVLDPLFKQDATYMEDEGFSCHDHYLKAVIGRQLVNISNLKGDNK